jgi:hypothetical protein
LTVEAALWALACWLVLVGFVERDSLMANDSQSSAGIREAYERATQRLCKWRTVFLGWMLGTVPDGTPGLKAHKDRVDAQIMHRVEINALTALLINKGVFTVDEFMAQIVEECAHKEREYEAMFPGHKATDIGVTIDIEKAMETYKRMGFPP